MDGSFTIKLMQLSSPGTHNFAASVLDPSLSVTAKKKFVFFETREFLLLFLLFTVDNHDLIIKMKFYLHRLMNTFVGKRKTLTVNCSY